MRTPKQKLVTNQKMFQHGIHLLNQGFSILPVKLNGSKEPQKKLLPGYKTKPFFVKPPSIEMLRDWFPDNSAVTQSGLMIVCGGVSGNLQVLDFEEYDLGAPFKEKLELIAPGLWQKLPRIKTPRPGFHLYFRVGNGSVLRSQHLARRPRGTTPNLLIESRGERSLVIFHGSPGSCHPSGKPYRLAKSSPGLDQVPLVTAEEWNALLCTARAFDQSSNKTSPKLKSIPQRRSGGKRSLTPWDDFNENGSWKDLLDSLGWSLVKVESDGTQYWKHSKASATYSACVNPYDTNRLRLFSTNVPGLESILDDQSTYSKFDVLKILKFKGNVKYAVEFIKQKGYRGTGFKFGQRHNSNRG